MEIRHYIELYQHLTASLFQCILHGYFLQCNYEMKDKKCIDQKKLSKITQQYK